MAKQGADKWGRSANLCGLNTKFRFHACRLSSRVLLHQAMFWLVMGVSADLGRPPGPELHRIALDFVQEFVSVKVMLFLCALSESLELRVGWYTNVHQPRNKHYRKPSVCRVPKHTAKADMHTVKLLPCAAHGKRHTAFRRRQRRSLPCANLGPRQKKWPPAKVTWKWVCRVPCRCGTRQRPNLCHVQKLLHTAKNGSFAVCPGFCTRQRSQIQIFLFVDYVYGTPSISYISQ